MRDPNGYGFCYSTRSERSFNMLDARCYGSQQQSSTASWS
jgi:hypothetical protein